MDAVRILRSLGPIDARSVGRDPLLRWMLVLPVFVAVMARWVFTLVLARLSEALGLDLLAYYAPIAGVALLLISPAVLGMVIGFLLLDQRDEGTLTALRVTPLPLGSYLVYRLAAPMFVSVVMTLVAFPVAGLVEVGTLPLLMAALASAPIAPVFALALATLAENKVQGFAFAKAASLGMIAPAVAYVVQPPWQWLFGIVPTYWPARLYWSFRSGSSDTWVYLVVALAYSAALLLALLRRLNND